MLQENQGFPTPLLTETTHVPISGYLFSTEFRLPEVRHDHKCTLTRRSSTAENRQKSLFSAVSMKWCVDLAGLCQYNDNQEFAAGLGLVAG